MVEIAKCEHCGAETKHPVTKVIDGKSLSFCCHGCLGVYEFLIEEGLMEQVREEEKKEIERLGDSNLRIAVTTQPIVIARSDVNECRR